MRLRDYATQHNIHYRTAWNHFRKGLIPGAYQMPTGTVIVPDPEPERADVSSLSTVVYARVSSSQNKDNLDSQADRVSKFCNARGWTVSGVVKETASGLNDRRPKLLKLIQDESVGRIVVEHKDRLTRFGFEYIKVLYSGDIVVINEVDEDEKDLMQDFTSIITSFCARIYGLRRAKSKTEKLIAELSDV